MLALGLASCEKRDPNSVLLFTSGNDYPRELSEWNLFAKDDLAALIPNDRVTPYDLNTPLFSDYAGKLRTIWVPGGEVAAYREHEVFELPIGTILSKTFYYSKSAEGELLAANRRNESRETNDRLLIETRLLVHTDDGWITLPYIWNEEQTNATLKVAGGNQTLSISLAPGKTEQVNYLVPDMNQCSGCHVTQVEHEAVTMPIGIRARHLNRDYEYVGAGEKNQLAHWRDVGFLTGTPEDVSTAPQNAVWNDATTGDVDDRARAYLDANCAHCHSASGPARTSGLQLEATEENPTMLGRCKSPIAAGRGSGGFQYDIVPGNPDESILFFRMETNDPGMMMPEIGRSIAHEEALDLMRTWIRQMDGACT